MSTVSRRGRLVDLAALACIVIGVLLCLSAASQLREIGKLSFRSPGPRQHSALAAADRARYMAYGGVATIVVGCLVGAASAIGHARAKRIS